MLLARRLEDDAISSASMYMYMYMSIHIYIYIIVYNCLYYVCKYIYIYITMTLMRFVAHYTGISDSTCSSMRHRIAFVYRHRLHGCLAQRVPSLLLASGFWK